MPYATTGFVHHGSSSSPSDILDSAREFIKDKLYFTCLSQHPPQYPNIHFFSIDHVLVYINFYSDFGPSNLAHVIRFCDMMQDKLQNPRTADKKICLYSSHDSDKRANAAFVMCAYMLIVHRHTPEEAFRPLLGVQPPFFPYRDAGYGAATYHITIPDCLRGLHKGLTLGLVDLDSVDVEEYEFYEKVENGDFNWITNKFIALASPKDDPPLRGGGAPAPGTGYGQHHAALRVGTNGWTSGFTGLFSRTNAVSPTPTAQRPPNAKPSRFHPAYRMDDLITYLKSHNVRTIVRLNNKTYDRTKFVEAGIEHVEMYFPDGTTPPDGILMRFLELCESRAGVIAVHCKAGLGRTGTLIAAYLMKHYKFTAAEVISFLRILRPGMVVGPQQNYLQSMQAKIYKLHPSSTLPPHISLLKSPTYPNLQRWTRPTLPSSTVRQPFRTEEESQKEHERRQIAKEEEREERERLERAAKARVQDMAIPLQPRKHMPGRGGDVEEVRERVQAARESVDKSRPPPDQKRPNQQGPITTTRIYNYITTTTTTTTIQPAHPQLQSFRPVTREAYTPRAVAEQVAKQMNINGGKTPQTGVNEFVLVGKNQVGRGRNSGENEKDGQR